MSIASEPKLCPKCGATIPSEAPQGLCPKCLLLEISTPTDAGQSAKSIPPTRDELAAAFPQLEILELIGQGGMGFVFKARQPKLDRFVALKILPQSLAADPAFAERFSREGRLLARLNHPNIVTVHDFGVASGILPDVEPGFQPGGKSADKKENEKISNAPVNASLDARGRMPRSTSGKMPDATFFYLLMEYVDGVNLRQAMKAGRFTAEQALAIVPKICEALQFAHNEGILHRDIKPENILLDTKGRVKIADFGIAKLVSEATSFGVPPSGGPDRVNAELQTSALTDAGKTLGTPNYMAPEQIKTPGAVDHRADIYSLGVVFYEMLTGELPLGRFAPPSQKSAADPRLDDVVLRALEREPNRRTQSAGEVKTQVETITSNLSAPVSDAPDLLVKPKRFMRRGVLGGFLVFILVVSATAVFSLLSPKTYKATALLLLETKHQFIQPEISVGSSDDKVLKKVSEDLNLKERWKTRIDQLEKNEPTLLATFRRYSASGDVQKLEATILLQRGLTVSRHGNTSIFEISFAGPDATEAAEIANAIAEGFRWSAGGDDSIRIDFVDKAVPNRLPVSPNIYRNIALGILGGALLGFFTGWVTVLVSRWINNRNTAQPSSIESEVKPESGKHLLRGVIAGLSVICLSILLDNLDALFTPRPWFRFEITGAGIPLGFVTAILICLLSWKRNSSKKISLSTVVLSFVLLAIVLIPVLAVLLAIALPAFQKAQHRTQEVREQIEKQKQLNTNIKNAEPNASADLQKAKANVAELRVKFTDEHPLVKAQLARLHELERTTKEEPNVPADLREARAKLAELRVDYTDDHSVVKALLARLRELERMEKEEPNASAALREAKAKLAEKRIEFTDGYPEVRKLKERVSALSENTLSSSNSTPILAVEAWLALIDEGKYAESWDAAAISFRKESTKEDWIDTAEMMHAPLGKLLSRKIKDEVQTEPVGGLPNTASFMVTFDSSFAKAKSAIEVALFTLDRNGRWKAASYIAMGLPNVTTEAEK